MKTFMIFCIFILVFFAIIIAIARPEIIKNKYTELRAPIDKYYAEKNINVWKEAKEAEKSLWMLKLQLPNDCRSRKSAIRELECNNIVQLHAQTFEKNWFNKVQSGWKPEGVSN